MKVASYDEIFRAIKGEPVATLCSISFKPWFDTLQGVPAVFHLFDLPLPEELIRILRLVEPFLVSPEAMRCFSGAVHHLACFAKKVASLISALSRLASQRLSHASFFVRMVKVIKLLRPGSPSMYRAFQPTNVASVSTQKKGNTDFS